MCVARKSIAPESQFTHGFIYRQHLTLDSKSSTESVKDCMENCEYNIQTAVPEQVSSECYVRKKEANTTLCFPILSGRKMLTKTI